MGDTFLVVCFLLNTLFLLLFEIELVNSSAAPIFSHFLLGKDDSYFHVSFPTTADHFYFLYSVFETLNTYTVTSMFVDRVQKRHFYLFVICKNISGNLFVVYFSLNMFFLPFFGVITWKSINHSYLVAVYTLNPPKAL